MEHQSTYAYENNRTMTHQGLVAYTLFYLLIFVATAVVGFNYTEELSNYPMIYISSIVITIGLGFFIQLTQIGQRLSPILAPIYLVIEGTIVGMISRYYEVTYGSIILPSITITILTFALMLVLFFRMNKRLNNKFRAVIYIGTLSVMFVYLFSFILSLLNIPNYMFAAGPLGLAVSVVTTTIAVLSLLIRFEYINDNVTSGTDKKYTSFNAFYLMLGIIWVYLEVLRLLRYLRD